MKDLMVMCDDIDSILGYDQRDCGKRFFPDTLDFNEWHRGNKLLTKDKEGKDKGSSQIFYKIYLEDIVKGKVKETPYCDFWHWMVDNCFGGEFRNDSVQRLYLGNVVTFTEEWQKVVYKVWQDTYKDLCDEDGYLEVNVCW